MKIANEWKDYKILDMADGQKLEKSAEKESSLKHKK